MQTNVLNAAMKYGLIMGLIFSVNFLLSVTGNPIISLLGYLVVAVILVLTYRFSVAIVTKKTEEQSLLVTHFSLFCYFFFLPLLYHR